MRVGNELCERAHAHAQVQIALQREALELQRRQLDPPTAARSGEGVGSE